ncbi:hypothetical protein AB0P05_26690 [Streptomyces flaveolus]|uniref:hypothetical protein n=1 Tax=Streptomyces flaveolus TaxID=67297 RepID=UPI003439BD45
MISRYALVVSHYDRSGIIQAFGPYDSPKQAEASRDAIQSGMPLLSIAGGMWEVVPMTDLGEGQQS